MALHVGIFVVWLPTVLVTARSGRGMSRNQAFKVMLSGSPPWMRHALWGLLAYAALNFVLFAVFGERAPSSASPSASTIRGFSGHWMFFYWFAFATLYSAAQKASQRAPSG
jgi:hypothetical protein